MLNALTPEELYRHLIVFGSTGSGKTRHVILPLLASLLARDADDPEKCAGVLLFDVKGDMAQHVRAVMRAAGREDEVIVLGRGGDAWLDPFEDIEKDSRAVAERVIEIVRGIHPEATGAAYDDFWRENNRRFLQIAVIIARAEEFGDLRGIDGLARGIGRLCAARPKDEDDEPSEELDLEIASAAEGGWISRADAEMARTYLRTELCRLSAATWSVISNYATSYLSCLRDSRISSILRPGPGHRFKAEDVIDRGRVILISLSRIHFGPAAEVYRTMIKTAFQQCALQRFARSFFDGRTVRAINSTRPVFLVADEFPSLVSVGTADDGDAFFLDKAREVRVGCILSAQGLSALSARMPFGGRANHLLNNCCSKIFLSTDCPETLDYFQGILPMNGEPSTGIETPPSFEKAPSAFRLPNYEFASTETLKRDGNAAMASPLCRGQLQRLDVGEGIMVRPRGVVERVQFPAFSAS